MKPRIALSAILSVLVVSAFGTGTVPLGDQKDENQPGSILEYKSPEQRLALVIGNAKYDVSPLRNPVNDARAIATTLRHLGFEVAELENLGEREMKNEIRAFGMRIVKQGVALFYYAGHGLQQQGRNYLVPTDAKIEREEDLQYEAVGLDLVLNEMLAAENRVNIVILDACRNNPFARSFRSSDRGLAVVSAPSGTLIAYATAPGQVANDGPGQNGLYTEELLKQIRTPDLKLEDVFKRVRVVVREKTKGRQVPWEASSLEGDFYFISSSNPTQLVGPVDTGQDSSSVKGTLWSHKGWSYGGKQAFIEFLEGGRVRKYEGYKGVAHTPSNVIWYQTGDIVHIILYEPNSDKKVITTEFEGVVRGSRIEGKLRWAKDGRTINDTYLRVVQ